MFFIHANKIGPRFEYIPVERVMKMKLIEAIIILVFLNNPPVANEAGKILKFDQL